jgi:hypothetical protein
VQPAAIWIGGTPRAAARRRANLMPTIGDAIRPPGTADTIVLSGSDDEIDPRVLT